MSGLIFIVGAVGLESIAGYYQELHGVEYYLYSVIYTTEELLEMCGIALFIYALLDFMKKEMEFVNIKFLN